MNKEVSRFFQAVTALVFVSDPPEHADAIFVPGSSRAAHVLLAASLYREGFAPLIVPSGYHPYGKERFDNPDYASEWAWMYHVLTEHGVPASAILREDRATFTWENARLSREACDRAGLTIRKAILTCKPYHARRALMYYQTAFPETEWLVCPADMPGFNADDWFRTPEGRDKILGEVRRLGSQINPQLEEMISHG